MPSSDSSVTPTPPPESIRTEDILLERLKNEQPIKAQVSSSFVIAIVMLVIGLGTLIFFITKRPEKFAEQSNPHAKENHEAQAQAAKDSADMIARRSHFAPIVDSLKKALDADPQNLETQLHYANALYESSLWTDAEEVYSHYLKAKPKDTDARVDYAFVLTQTTHDFHRAVEELEKVLALDPTHIKALFNAGLLSIQAFENREEALTKATGYFQRARKAAEDQHQSEMLANIEQILAELEKAKAGGK